MNRHQNLFIIIITILSSSSSALCTTCFQDHNLFIIIIITIDITTFTLSAALAAFSHWCLNLSTRFMAYFAALVKLNLAIFAKLNLSCSWSWRLFANWTHSLEPARLLSPSPKLIKLLTKNINWNVVFVQVFLK